MSVEECVLESGPEAAHEAAKEIVDAKSLIGVWKLVSSQATVTHQGKTEAYSTKNPKGYLILTPWQRMMTVSIGGDGDRKKIPTSDSDLSDLWKSLLAYTGKFRVEGEYLVTTVDVAWYELWTGTEQRRKFQLDGDTLTIVTKPQPIGGQGPRGKALVSCKVVWMREE
ncbi:MAG: lipocalin-like domain-containing protein [Acidobacteriota bacterium]|nr:lipocalin-like domain-containing protein [Acidobacteriota bacterium]